MEHEVNASSPASKASTWWHYPVVAAVAAVCVLWKLGAAGLVEHEAKLAVPAQNMFNQTEWLVPGVNLNGWPYHLIEPTPVRRWLVPIANGRPRLVKTPLPYWTAAAMAHLVGGASPFSTRLSSAFAAILVALIALAFARRLFSTRAAFIGAIMLATSLGLVKYGRNARPEMLLCLFCTAAMASFYVALEARTRTRHVLWMAAFWVLMGFANLAKQLVPLLLAWPLAAYLAWQQTTIDSERGEPERPLRTFLILSGAGLAVHILTSYVPALRWWRGLGVPAEKGPYLSMAVCIGLPMLWYLVRARAWRRIIPILPTAIPGLIVMSAMLLWWMWYMAHLFGGFADSVFSYEVDLQATGLGSSHPAVPWFYISFLLMLTIPWIGFLPEGFAAPFTKRFKQDRKALVYLFLWSVGVMLLFTAAVAKRKHYILPMLPAICLSMGYVAEDVCWRRQMKPKIAKFMAVLSGITAALLAVGAVGAFLFAPKDWEWRHAMYMLPVPAVLLFAVARLVWRGRMRPLIPLITVMIVSIYLVHYGMAERWDQRRGFIEFGHKAAEIVPPGDPVYHWDGPQAKTVFYFGRNMPDIRWRFLSEDPRADGATIRERVIAWLEQDPSRAPWIVVYGDRHRVPGKKNWPPKINEEDVLAKLGYKPVLTVDVDEDAFSQLVLYEYMGAASRSASGD